jgi:transcriptional regulator with XRE-family HTH domain
MYKNRPAHTRRGICTSDYEMSPHELRQLRRRLGMTQADFAERWGVSTSLVTSLEVGRRKITARSRREIAQIFADESGRAPIVQKTAPVVGSHRRSPRAAPHIARSKTLLDLLRGLTDTPTPRLANSVSGPVSTRTSAWGSKTASKFVQSVQPASAPVSNPATVPIVAWSKCTWRDPEVGLCGALTPQGMLYCALHMTLAMIEGRPTRRR